METHEIAEIQISYSPTIKKQFRIKITNSTNAYKSVKWDYYLIKEYESFWDWDALQDNIGVFKRVSLHLGQGMKNLILRIILRINYKLSNKIIAYYVSKIIKKASY